MRARRANAAVYRRYEGNYDQMRSVSLTPLYDLGTGQKISGFPPTLARLWATRGQ